MPKSPSVIIKIEWSNTTPSLKYYTAYQGKLYGPTVSQTVKEDDKDGLALVRAECRAKLGPDVTFRIIHPGDPNEEPAH